MHLDKVLTEWKTDIEMYMSKEFIITYDGDITSINFQYNYIRYDIEITLMNSFKYSDDYEFNEVEFKTMLLDLDNQFYNKLLIHITELWNSVELAHVIPEPGIILDLAYLYPTFSIPSVKHINTRVLLRKGIFNGSSFVPDDTSITFEEDRRNISLIAWCYS